MRQIRACFAALVLLSSLLAPVLSVPNVAAHDKIEPALLDQFTIEGAVDYVVLFVEQADLSPAYDMGRQERGVFVYDSLRRVAGRSQLRAKEILNQAGLAHHTFIAGNELYVWAGDLDTAEVLAELAGVAYVRSTRISYVDPIIEETPSTPVAPDTLAWGISWTRADQFWSTFTVQGDGIVVAGIDTGVQWDHPALVNAFNCPGDPSNSACWYDPEDWCGGSACDNNGHGTHTMGTMVADDNPGLTWQAGMAPNAHWIACKGCGTSSCSEFALNACADWLLAPGGNPANRPHVVNNSWGGDGCDTWYQGKVDAWRASGIFPAFSAGNSGPGCDTLGSPGDYQVSFSSAAHDDSGTIAYFSSRGSDSFCFGHDPYTKPNIAAPGVFVCSTYPGSSWSCGYSGTSMASPHTAGAVALLWSCNPALAGRIELTFQALQSTASPSPAGSCGAPPDGGGNYTFGYGYLNILAAGQQYCGDLEFGYLNGYVYDVGDGTPIEGANVSAFPSAYGLQAVTDPTGYYTTSLIPGTYDVTASRHGYGSGTVGGVQIVADTVTRQDLYLTYYGEWVSGPSACFDFTRFDAEYLPATGKIYVLGGRYGNDTYGDIYEFDPASGACADTGANMPVPISNYTVNLLNDGSRDLLCTFGGRSAGGGTTGEVQCYDPIANSASVVAQLPAGYGSYLPGAQVVVDNVAYILGGFDPVATPSMTAVTYAYDPVSNTFTQLGNLSLARSYLFADAVDGLIYAFGGTTFDGAGLIAQTIAERMDPAIGTWDDAAVADLPQPLGEGSAFGFDSESSYTYAGQIVLAGGGAWPEKTADVILYDIVGNSYDNSFPDLIQARRNHAGVFVPTCSGSGSDGLPGMWVFGGRVDSDDPPFGGTEYFGLACDCVPVSGVSISGPGSLVVGSPGSFSATYTPPDADSPTLTWDDGSVGPTAVYSWTDPGTYQVTVTATNACSSIRKSISVDVFCQPVEDVTIAGPTRLPQNVAGAYAAAYSPMTTSLPLTLSWSNGTMGPNATYIWSTTGPKAVTATADSRCGQAQDSLMVEVFCQPVEAASIAGPPTLLVGQEGLYQATAQPITSTPPLTFTWDNATIGAQAPYSWPMTGTYTLTVTTSNACGSAQSDFTVNVIEAWPTAVFLPLIFRHYQFTICVPLETVSIEGPDLLLPGSVGLYTATYGPADASGPVRLLWDNGATSPTAAYSWTAPGSYTVTVIAANFCADVRDSLVVTVPCEPLQEATIAGPLVLLVGETGLYTATYAPPTATLPISFTWDNGAVGPTAAYSWTLPGTYTLAVTASNICGQVTGTAAVVVQPTCLPVSEPAFTWTPLTPTVGQPVTFEASAAGTLPISFSWAFGDGNLGQGQMVSHTYVVTGSYWVVLTARNACGEAVVTHTINVVSTPWCYPLQGAYVDGPGYLLMGEAAAYTATYLPLSPTLPVTFTWDNGAVGPTAPYSWTTPGLYAILVTATNACGQVQGILPVTVFYPWNGISTGAYNAAEDDGQNIVYLPNTYWSYYSWYSHLSIQNLTASPQDVTLTFYQEDSDVVCHVEGPTSVPAYSSWHLDTGTLDLSPCDQNWDGFFGLAVASAGGPIAAVDNHILTLAGYYYNGASSGFWIGADTLHVPELYRNTFPPDNWNSNINIQNVGTGSTLVTVHFVVDPPVEISTTLDTFQSWFLYLPTIPELADAPDGPLSAIISSDGEPLLALVQSSTPFNAAQTYEAMPLGTTVNTVPAVSRNHNGWDSSFTVQNLGVGAVVIEVAYGPNRNPYAPPWPGASYSTSIITPGASLYIDQGDGDDLLFAATGERLPRNYVGVATLAVISGTGPLATVVDTINTPGNSSSDPFPGDWTYAYQALATEPYATVPLTIPFYIYYPLLFNESYSYTRQVGPWRSSFALVNLGSTDGTVSVAFYDEIGAAYTPACLRYVGDLPLCALYNPFTLPAGASERIDLAELLGGDLPAGRYAAVVSSDQPIGGVAVLQGVD